jgi:hypothetical protein
MNPWKKSLTAGLAVALLALVAAASASALAKKPKPKPTPAPGPTAAKVAGEIAELERTASALGAEVAALSARTATLEGEPPARTEVTTTASPTPAPPAPAGGDFSGSFPDPKLRPKTVGLAQLADGSVDGGQVVDGSILGATAIAPHSILGDDIGPLSAADFSTAVSARTLEDLTYIEGQRDVFELGRDDGQTLSLSTSCPDRIISGGWRAGGSSYGIEIMASVPAFFEGGKSPERDWIVAAREQLPHQSVRSTFAAHGLCLR